MKVWVGGEMAGERIQQLETGCVFSSTGNTEAGENFPVWIITSHEGYSEGPFFFYFFESIPL